MKIQFLGTAAAEAIPALFCDCEVCRRARKLGGKELRTRSQAILDDTLLIDYPSDSLAHFRRFNIDTSKIRNILITHIHEDHFYPEDFGNIRPGYSHLDDGHVVRVYGSEDILAPLSRYVEASDGKLEAIALKPFETVNIDGYEVTPLKATHSTEHPYIYLIKKGSTAMLYAHDTGIFPEETIEYLADKHPKLALVSYDCTGGAAADLSYDAHMCLGRAAYLRDEMEYAGFLSPNSVAVLNHFSHNGESVNYEDLEEIAMNEGFLVSYDGMHLEF